MTNAVAPQSSGVASKRSASAYEAPERVLSTLNSDGSRRWLRPRLSPGRFLRARRCVAYFLIALFATLPFIQIAGKPAVLLDVARRQFTIFGTTFLPTDTLLLALLLVGVVITIFLATALLGRLWCGWACPQTVYMEFVYRPIERLFDGAPGRRSGNRFQGSGFATALKYATFVIVSVIIAHIFLAYFVGVEQLAAWMQRSPLEHPAGFLIVASVTALALFDFCFFREQTCILACPYGRFQSVMLDRQSLVISYDSKRGEPRGRIASKHNDAMHLPVLPSQGDCVDCSMCVTTCPTGIDIRGGLQMECIGCAQCIDACDTVMTKLGRSTGLIRYTSQAAMAGERTRLLRPRAVIYPLLLVIIASLFVMSLVNRADANVTVLRGLGRPFTVLTSGEIANQIRIKVVNRTDRVANYMLAVEHADVSTTSHIRIQVEESPLTVNAGESRTIPVMIIASPELFLRGKHSVTIAVSDGNQFMQRSKWELLGPAAMPSTTEANNG